MDHRQFLLDIAEIDQVFADTATIETFLQKIVTMIGKHLHAGVCSIYLFDKVTQELVLHANTGLNLHAAGRVALRKGEGIVSAALEELRPIRVDRGSQDPRFKPISGLDEERFDAYCAVPILRGIVRIGVLVVQRDAKRAFTDDEMTVLRVVTNQLAALIENARMLIEFEAGETALPASAEKLRGTSLPATPFSAGFAYAPASIQHGGAASLEWFTRNAHLDTTTAADFDLALRQTSVDLKTLQSAVEKRLADAGSLIFGAHLLLLQDEKFIGEMSSLIRAGTGCVKAVLEVTRRYLHLFERLDDTLLREKGEDIKDLACRVLRNLMPQAPEALSAGRRHIVIARDLLPSGLLKLAVDQVSGVILVSGGTTSHVSILARSLNLPLMICDHPELLSLPEGTMVLMDNEQSRIYIEPDHSIVEPFLAREKSRALRRAQPRGTPSPARTADGHIVTLLTNINLLSDLDCALAADVDGVGLYRTEFPFLIRSSFPTEEEQYRIYRRLDDALPGKPVTFRTLDVGGDKVLPYFDNLHEDNPFLGMRSIRFSLNRRDLFIEQLRAILRAGRRSRLRIMFPMIGSIEELTDARSLVQMAMESLDREGIECNRHPAIGMMVELPSVLPQIDLFARSVDFFSIGTNDFIQYMLAVDRTNQKVAGFYLPHHPAVLRGISLIAAAAREAGIEVSVCGEMAHIPCYVPFLLGCGIDALSVDPLFLPNVKKMVGRINLSEATDLCDRVLACDSSEEIGRLLGVPAP